MARYGRDALVELRTAVTDLKNGDPLRPVTVLAPNNLAALTARRFLAHGIANRPGVANVEVTTLAKLAERIAAPAMGSRRPMTTPVMVAAWRRALARDPGCFEPVADHPATVEALARSYQELRSVSPDALDVIAAGSSVTRDLVRLFRDVRSTLTNGWYDTTDLLGEAARQVPAGRYVLYLFQDLTEPQLTLCRALESVGNLQVVAGLTGAARADHAIEAGLAALGFAAATTPAAPTATNVINASDADDEIRCVVRDLTATLRTTPAHRVAILYSNASPYARLLHETLAAADITVNGPSARPVSERSTARLLLDILSLPDSNMARPALFHAVSNAPTRNFGGERIRTARWERLSREAGVVSGDDWTTRLNSFIDAQRKIVQLYSESTDDRWRAVRAQLNIDDALELQTFALKLRSEFVTASNSTTWQALADWSRVLIESLLDKSKLPIEEQYALRSVFSAINAVSVLDAVDEPANFDLFRQVLATALDDSLPRVGRFGEGVLVAPVSSAIGLELDVVYVVGLSEDLYPGRIREDALLPDRVRLAPGSELRPTIDRLYAKYRHLLAAFQVAPRVVASFPRGDLRRSSERLPSRWLLPTLREISNDHTLSATDWATATFGDAMTHSGSFAGQLLSTRVLSTEQEWRTRQAFAGRLEDDVVAAARELLSARASSTLTRFDGNLTTEAGLPNYAVDNVPISPTALEAYAGCPHAFFVERLLRVSPIEQPENLISISPKDVGTLIHESMDRLIKQFSDNLPDFGEPWPDKARTAVVEIANELAEEFQSRGLTGHPRLWERERERIVNTLIDMLEADNEWRQRHDAKVIASEMAFGMDGQPPAEIPIASGRVIMRGAADRVDITRDGALWVTDIKTGSPRSFKNISPGNPVLEGTKLQLPVYAHAARERHGTDATAVHASYWFVRKQPGRKDLELTEDVQQIYAETLETLVSSIAKGLFPPKPPESDDFAGFTLCPYCNPDDIGYAGRDGWKQKRSDSVVAELVGLIDPDGSNS